MDYPYYLELAKQKLQSGNYKGKQFKASDLVDADVWSSADKLEKMGFGRAFANEVREGRVPDVVIIEGKGTKKYKQQ